MLYPAPIESSQAGGDVHDQAGRLAALIDTWPGRLKNHFDRSGRRFGKVILDDFISLFDAAR